MIDYGHQFGKERLTKLAELLETIPEEQYNQDTWGNHLLLDEDPKYVGCDVRGHAKLNCQTEACSLGWATTLWPKIFILLVDPDDYEHTGSMAVFFEDKYHIVDPYWTDKYEEPGNKFVREFFGLTKSQAEELFGANNRYHVATPKTKAEQIRNIIAESF